MENNLKFTEKPENSEEFNFYKVCGFKEETKPETSYEQIKRDVQSPAFLGFILWCCFMGLCIMIPLPFNILFAVAVIFIRYKILNSSFVTGIEKPKKENKVRVKKEKKDLTTITIIFLSLATLILSVGLGLFVSSN